MDYKYLEASYSDNDSLRPYASGSLQMRSYGNRFIGFNLEMAQYEFPEIRLGMVMGRGFLEKEESMHGVLDYHLFTAKKGHGISYTGRLISDGDIRMGIGLGYGFYWSRKENISLWTLEMILGYKRFWVLLNSNTHEFNNWFANGNYYYLGIKKQWGLSVNYILPLYNQKTAKIHYKRKYWQGIENGNFEKISIRRKTKKE